jgi:uncharacterized Zn-finger protein
MKKRKLIDAILQIGQLKGHNFVEIKRRGATIWIKPTNCPECGHPGKFLEHTPAGDLWDCPYCERMKAKIRKLLERKIKHEKKNIG